jgi:BirA family biotin operon repressor/biotin-[acetyl-CoA-carboxylase] ligase
MNELQPDRLREFITGRWGASLDVREQTESTMDDASAAAAAGAADGHVVLADQQTRGRGAHGRSWVSPAGRDLYFSIVARPDVAPSSMALITLATGLGVRDAVSSLLPDASVVVKWPNDIWIDRRKCAGILVESRMLGSKIDAVVIGVGLNVNRMEWPEELVGLATSLRMEEARLAKLDRGRVFGAVLSHIERAVGSFAKDGATVLVNALRPHLALVGETVRWDEGQGAFEGIDAHGAARVRCRGEVVTLHAARLEPVAARG